MLAVCLHILKLSFFFLSITFSDKNWQIYSWLVIWQISFNISVKRVLLVSEFYNFFYNSRWTNKKANSDHSLFQQSYSDWYLSILNIPISEVTDIFQFQIPIFWFQMSMNSDTCWCGLNFFFIILKKIQKKRVNYKWKIVYIY